MTGHIYVIQAQDSSIKIGIAGDVARRLSGLQGSHPHRLTLLHVTSCNQKMALWVETAAHEILSERRLIGEWFSVSPQEAIDAINAAAAKLKVPLTPVDPSAMGTSHTAAKPTARPKGNAPLPVTVWLSPESLAQLDRLLSLFGTSDAAIQSLLLQSARPQLPNPPRHSRRVKAEKPPRPVPQPKPTPKPVETPAPRRRRGDPFTLADIQLGPVRARPGSRLKKR